MADLQTEPDHVVVIGAQRCGTTYLHRMLEAHPGVAMARPSPPEPKVFLDDAVLAQGGAGYREAWFGHRSGAEVLLGEKSTSYLEHPRAIDRIRVVLGDPWILVQLRDPVARAVSNWRFSTHHGVETLPLDEAVRADLADNRPWDRSRFSVSPYRYVHRGRYAEQLRPWLDAFGDRVLVTFLEELVGRDRTAQDLFDRLGLPGRPPEITGAVNASAGAAPGLDPALVAELREHYAEPDARLATMLGRPLPWPRAEETR